MVNVKGRCCTNHLQLRIRRRQAFFHLILLFRSIMGVQAFHLLVVLWRAKTGQGLFSLSVSFVTICREALLDCQTPKLPFHAQQQTEPWPRPSWRSRQHHQRRARHRQSCLATPAGWKWCWCESRGSERSKVLQGL